MKTINREEPGKRLWALFVLSQCCTGAGSKQGG